MRSIQHQEILQGCVNHTHRSLGATKQCNPTSFLTESQYHSVTSCLDNQVISLSEWSLSKIGQSDIEDSFIPNNIEEVGAVLSDCELSRFNDNEALRAFVNTNMGEIEQVDALESYFSSVVTKIGKEISTFELELKESFLTADLPYTLEDYYAVTIRSADQYNCQNEGLGFRIESVGLLNFFYYNIDLLSDPYRELAALLILTLDKFGKMNIISQDEYSFIDQLTELVSEIPTSDLITLSKLSDSLPMTRYKVDPKKAEAIMIEDIVLQLNNIDKEIVNVLLEWHEEITPLALEDIFNKVNEVLEKHEHTKIYDELNEKLLYTDHLSYLSKLIEHITSTTTVPLDNDAKLLYFAQSTLPILKKYFVSTDCHLAINDDNSGETSLSYDIQFIGSGCSFEEEAVNSVDNYMMEVGETPMVGVHVGHENFLPFLKQIAVTVQVLHGLNELKE